MQVSNQVRVESWTDPLAACEDSSSWCWVLVRPEASPPELAVPGFHYSLHPAGGDSVRQRGLRRREKQTWVFSYMTHFLTSSIRSLALPISSGMDASLLLLTRRTLRGRLNKYFGKTDSRFRLWRKIKHWPTLQRHDWTCTSEYLISGNRVSANREMCVMFRFSVCGPKWGTSTSFQLVELAQRHTGAKQRVCIKQWPTWCRDKSASADWWWLRGCTWCSCGKGLMTRGGRTDTLLEGFLWSDSWTNLQTRTGLSSACARSTSIRRIQSALPPCIMFALGMRSDPWKTNQWWSAGHQYWYKITA